jgi:snurportin-1
MSEAGNIYFSPEDGNETKDEVSLFCDFYKYSNRTMSFTQEKKRQLFLQKQKEKRSEAFDEKRDLSELFNEGDTLESMECETVNKRKKYKKVPFGYKLMGSEWLTEVPEDLADNWLVKLCPEGVRYLIVANKAITTCYFRNGKPCFKFKSKLPGGSADCGHRFTVLDCIYNKNLNTLFIYDVLAWNSTSLLNAEAHMRFCWLKSKFEDNPEISQINQRLNFVVMDFFPAQNALLQDHLFTPFTVNDQEIPFDGILFYHREGHYVFHSTPLVGWLKVFMLPEILHIDVHPSHLHNKPQDYESIQQYLSSKKKKKRKEKETEDLEMELAEAENIECDDM